MTEAPDAYKTESLPRQLGEHRRMLAFDHIPRGVTTNQNFDIMKCGRPVQRVVASTVSKPT